MQKYARKYVLAIDELIYQFFNKILLKNNIIILALISKFKMK